MARPITFAGISPPNLAWHGEVLYRGSRVYTRVIVTYPGSGPTMKVECRDYDALGGERWEDGRGEEFVPLAIAAAMDSLVKRIKEMEVLRDRP
jgi:hypothetical protein